MDLNQFVIFAKVAKFQSFTKASMDLKIEKSTVSAKISAMEERLGVRLFHRTTRKVSLTEAGEALNHYCKQIVETAQEAELFAATLNNEPQGVLRISLPLDFAQLIVEQLVEPFLKAYPSVKLDISAIDREVDLIAERYDLTLRIGPGVLKDSTLVAKKLFDVKMGFFASPNYLEAWGMPEHLESLEEHRVIVFRKQQDSAFRFDPQFIGNAPSVKGSLQINDILTCRQAAISNLGIALLPEIICKPQIDRGLLVPVLIHAELPMMALFAVYASRKWIPSKLKVFLQYLEQ